MPLSVNGTIFYQEIESIEMLKSNSVYLLKGHGKDRIVIKREYTDASVIKSAKSMAKVIDRRSNLKILGQPEVAALSHYILAFKQAVREFEILGMPLSANEQKAVSDLQYCMGVVQANNGSFLKMDPVEVADLWTALEARLGPNADKTDLRSFTSSLNAPGGLEKLGQIIALDLFNNNTDRFNPAQPSSLPIGDQMFQLRCLSSPQNVFRIKTDTGFEVGLLDYIPLNSPFKDINLPLADGERASGEKWPGRILADRHERKRFAEDVVHDFEKLLNPHKNRFSLKKKLKGDPVHRIVEGMVQACRMISTGLRSKYYPARWTQGIEDRAQIIGKAVA